ncbi:uncharacterized protein DSM5745_08737 [Aspergillus mulundensis]|uniref:NB-ARC domain-containing protein n=1 Tax=Aspergillus mulundensis TaxID=1810919 RepID=A0A3D8R4R9_9EURO|nr:hypothetical protein DSM5745_08737 [Aspergillus mulundensis]RDW68977.1 hypothetical protein DSM5745_08737 [Aspergillus mulundensis]
MVPFARNPRFVGRQHELQQLKEWTSTPNGPRKIAIAELGGVGKTQVALELAYQTRDDEPNCSVLWLPCISREAVEQAYLAIAKTLGIHAEPNFVKTQVKSFLSQTKEQWLLIFDNADDMDMWTSEKDHASESKDSGRLSALKDFLLSSDHGRIVFTTRSRQLAVRMAAPSSYVIQLVEPNEADSMTILQKSLIDKNLLDDTATGMALLEQLSFLPLAITQATAFINENGISLCDYLDLLREQEEDVSDLLSKDYDDEGRYDNLQNPLTIFILWRVSIRELSRESFLPEPESKLAMVEALGLLGAYSFITSHQGDGSVSIHRLVFLATRNWLRKEQKLSSYIAKAANRFNQVFPRYDHTKRQLWRECLPHILELMEDDAFKKKLKKGLYMDLLRRVSFCLYEDGRYQEVELLTRHRIAFLEDLYGDNIWETLECMSFLAHLQLRQGRLQEAEEFGVQAAHISKEVLGPDDILTLGCMQTLGDVYKQQGGLDEAEKLQSKILITRREVLGSDHYDTLESMGYLALIYRNQGRYRETEELQTHVLKIQTEVLGLEHPLTLATMHNLALAYYFQDRFNEAGHAMEQAFHTSEKVIGLEHPDTLRSMMNLGRIYIAQSRAKDAKGLLRHALDIAGHVLGGDHPDTLMTMSHLTASYTYQARYREAEELEGLVLKLRTKTLGPAHPDTLDSMYFLAGTWRNMGKIIDAIHLMEEYVEFSTQRWGVDNPEIVRSRNVLEHWKRLNEEEAHSSDIEKTSATEMPPGIGDSSLVQETSDMETSPDIDDTPVDDASDIEPHEAKETPFCETESSLALRLSRAYPYLQAIGLPRPYMTSPLGVLYAVSGVTTTLPQ